MPDLIERVHAVRRIDRTSVPSRCCLGRRPGGHSLGNVTVLLHPLRTCAPQQPPQPLGFVADLTARPVDPGNPGPVVSQTRRRPRRPHSPLSVIVGSIGLGRRALPGSLSLSLPGFAGAFFLLSASPAAPSRLAWCKQPPPVAFPTSLSFSLSLFPLSLRASAVLTCLLATYLPS